MIKEALQYLIGLGNVETKEIGGEIFSTQKLYDVPQATPSALQVHNLSGLVDYLKTNYDKLGPVLIQVASPTEVNVFSSFNRDQQRNHFLQVSALLPRIPFEQFMEVERFNILLQSCFVVTESRAKLLSIVGTIQDENVATFGDDGVTQTVTAKSGLASAGMVNVPNPISLKPFRTFIDIEQPESQFVFRMQKGPVAALFEADGGAWKLDAIYKIRNFLLEQLAKQIDAEQVTIIA